MVGEAGPDEAPPLPWLAAPLTRALAQPGHALLLLAAPGVGALELQLMLAQAWLCEADRAGPGAHLRCGCCTGCRLVAARSHPDLLLRVPQALALARGWTQATDEPGKTRPSRQIRIDDVRSAIAWVATTSSRAGAKVLLLHPAEALNDIAANALLKTLEEPPPGVRIVLSCSDPQALLPTVRSRCQRVAIALPPADQAIAWLTERGVREPAVLLAAAAGRPLDALALHAAGVDGPAWRALPAALAAGRGEAWSGWALPAVVDSLGKLQHDLAAVAVGAPPRYFPRDVVPRAAAIGPLLDWGRALADAARTAEHPWHEPLRVQALLAHGAMALATLPP